jgi:anthranilate synthase component 1
MTNTLGSTTLSSEFHTPTSLYLKLTAKTKSKQSFLFESAGTTQTISRFSFVGADPRKILRSGPGYELGECDPLPALEAELSQYRVASIGGELPPLIGGAIGFVGYDNVRYFEPRTKRDMKDVLGIPEALFMLFDTIIAVDHFFQVVKVFTYLKVPENLSDEALEAEYSRARTALHSVVDTISSPDIPLPPQGPIERHHEYTSNIGQAGYEAHVKKLKEHISKG